MTYALSSGLFGIINVMKTVGIIPSRYGSSRFPGKPLAMLAGRPLVAWVVDAVKKAKSLDDVIVATDDERIVAASARSV